MSKFLGRLPIPVPKTTKPKGSESPPMRYKVRRRRYLPVLGPSTTPSAAADIALQTPDSSLVIGELKAQIKQLEAALAVKSLEARQLHSRASYLDGKLAHLQGELERKADFVTRTRQDMELLRKRMQREKEETQKFAAEEVLRQLIPMLDNFTYALGSLPEDASAEMVIGGMNLLHRETLKVLGEISLEVINAEGVPFDPTIHDAATTIADENKDNGVIVKVLRPGYRLKDKVLRPAMVAVNKIT